MNKKNKIALIILLSLGLVALIALLLAGTNIAVLNPKGTIAAHQRNLMTISVLMTLMVVIPVFMLTFYISWKYRAGNTKAQYRPNWDGNRKLELLWWAIPGVLILVLSGIIWKSSHDLDPFRPLESDVKPVRVQVVALQWKWLFIYPDYNIASVNLVQFPEDTPINFDITADAPMNSFWIPQLGGQVYAMAGMNTKLHLMANEPGEYKGSSANISGEGFAGMKFVAKASSQAEFEQWVQSVKRSEKTLSVNEYDTLARPSQNQPAIAYALADEDLYNKIIMKYMTNSAHKPDAEHH